MSCIPSFRDQQRLGVSDAGVKWPNDIWVNRKKLAGILTDSSILGSAVLAMVGVGVRLITHCFEFSFPPAWQLTLPQSGQ